MKTLLAVWHRFRAWRLNRWADSLLHEAEQHKKAAIEHGEYAALFWMKSSDVRSLARRLRAAGS